MKLFVTKMTFFFCDKIVEEAILFGISFCLKGLSDDTLLTYEPKDNKSDE